MRDSSRGQRPGWWPASETLAPGPAAQAAAERIWASSDLRSVPLGALLPGLSDLPVTPPPSQCNISVRAHNVLRRHSPDAWPDLAAMSAELIAAWPGTGVGTVLEIVRATVERWLEGGHEAANALTNGLGSADDPRFDDDAVWTNAIRPALADLVRLAYRRGATNVAQSLKLAQQADPEEPLGRCLAALANVECTALLGQRAGAEALQAALEAYLPDDERQLAIVELRMFPAGRRATLDELGSRLGVTRERVRQLESRLVEELNEARELPEVWALDHAAARLRQRLGSAAPQAAVQDALNDLLGCDHGLHARVLMALAGPYEVREQLWQCERPIDAVKRELVSSGGGYFSREQIALLLAAQGVVEQHVDECLRQLPVRAHDGQLVLWTGSLSDKAQRMLDLAGEPMSRAQLHAAVGEDVNFRSLLGQVQGDARFRRLGLDRYGLAAWGGEEYTNIVDELEQAIHRRGGSAPLAELVAELVDSFGVSEYSVRHYASLPQFVRQSDGNLVVEHGASQRSVSLAPPELDRDLVLLGGVWHLRVVVDFDVLRGSGRMLRNAHAQAAGVAPGQARSFEVAGERVELSWRGKQPALGSLRRVANTVDCVEGDILFVPLADGTPAALRRDALDGLSGIARVAASVGVPTDAGLVGIARAMALDDDSSADAVAARLLARGQPELAQMLDTPLDPDSVLDELVGLGD